MARAPKITLVLVTLLGIVAVWCAESTPAEEARRAISNPPPTYPEMAKRMQLVGVVKIELTIASDGRIKEAKVIGGHPILVDAAMAALRD
jgi:outer membrane biosynthesis protein TonB